MVYNNVWPFSGACCRLQRQYRMTCSGKADRSAEMPRGKDLGWPMMEAVTNIRASIMLMTCITILAVDFQVGKLNLQLLVCPSARDFMTGSTTIVFLYLHTFKESCILRSISCCLHIKLQVFPRRFAKTEVFGTGLMDLGVGATIFAR